MSPSQERSGWWDLHLRKARGESLTNTELQFYEEELARQDRESPSLQTNLETLRQLRCQMLATANVNSELRNRLSDLEKEIRLLEQSLSLETRQVLGVGE